MKQRQTELDILRFLALFAVILIHVSGGFELLGPMFMPLLVWCVPVFIMLSGRFFLDEEKPITVKKLLQKYLLRIVLAFVVWSGVYTIYYMWSGVYDILNIKGILAQCMEGPYHFWYLYMLAGLYMLTPFLRKITQDKQLCDYFLVLFAVFNIITEYVIFIPKIGDIIAATVNKLGINMVLGYVGYFVLGNYIQQNKEKITPKIETLIYGSGMGMLILTCVLENMIRPELRQNNFVKQYMKPNVVIYSSAIFTLFIKRISRIHFSPKIQRIFAKLTELGFGVYILHALVADFLVDIFQMHSYLALVLMAAVVCGISLCLTWLIRSIPLVGKRIT